ncbi:MAG TPA: hypothetical protein VJN02_11700 [Gammaproteobacteria bacterium]|nr:MAG: hypothetical protein A3E83_07030 [Gammaproteobacteria bacterium RIFCSPHIGHO2_12_FULL_41_20]HLB43486.1 hypothetical protein [Gammaproteobacteria bacterium]
MYTRIKDSIVNNTNRALDRTAAALRYIGVGGASVIGTGYYALWAMARNAAANTGIAALAQQAANNTAIAEAATTAAATARSGLNTEVVIASTGLLLGSAANIIDTLNTVQQNTRTTAAIARHYPVSGGSDATEGLPEELTTTASLTKLERVISAALFGGTAVLAVLGGLTIVANPVTGAVLFFTADLTLFGATGTLDLSYHNEAARLSQLQASLLSAPPAYAPQLQEQQASAPTLGGQQQPYQQQLGYGTRGSV